MLRTAALGLVAFPFASFATTEKQKTFVEPPRVPYAGSDDALLDEIEKKAFDFFWNEAGAATGQVKDRATQDGKDARKIASIAATGFGLSGLCIGHARGYGNKQEIVERVRSRGQVNRQRVRLAFSGDAVPEPETLLTLDGKDVGHVTRAARIWDPTGIIGMGYARKEAIAPGTVLQWSGGTATIVK